MIGRMAFAGSQRFYQRGDVVSAIRHGVTRRSAMQKLASIAITPPAVVMSSISAKCDTDLELLPSLRSLTHSSGIRYGCAGAAPIGHPDPVLLEKLATEANIFVPESSLKWAATEPQPGQFDFSEGDSIVAFATRNDMLIHGHTLVWYEAIPQWVSQIATAKDATTALERHISTEVQRYRGKIWAWDVVNEPIEPNDRLENGYRNSVWLRCLGIDYVDLSFRLARAADATTPLSLSEYGLEYATAECQRKREAVLRLLQKLRGLNTPIDCFGLQSHLVADEAFDHGGLTEFLGAIVKLGYQLMITELDVNDWKLVGNVGRRDAAVARHVAEYFDIVFSAARPISIATWGLSDRYTWLRQYYKRIDGSPLRPLPLDDNYQRKLMWATLAKYATA
jgi:endo-1,4-beta-xylanase